MRGGCGRCAFVEYGLVVGGLPFCPSSASEGLWFLSMVLALHGRGWGAWVPCGWGLGEVFERNWGGGEGQTPRCSLLEVLGRGRLPRKLGVRYVFPRWVRLLLRFG